jgi:hypothetical protein
VVKENVMSSQLEGTIGKDDMKQEVGVAWQIWGEKIQMILYDQKVSVAKQIVLSEDLSPTTTIFPTPTGFMIADGIVLMNEEEDQPEEDQPEEDSGVNPRTYVSILSYRKTPETRTLKLETPTLSILGRDVTGWATDLTTCDSWTNEMLIDAKMVIEAVSEYGSTVQSLESRINTLESQVQNLMSLVLPPSSPPVVPADA